MTKVVLFFRHPGQQGFSIERLFADVVAKLPADIFCTISISKFPSRGFFCRLYCIAEAALRRGPVNHITGDAHFLALGTPGNRTILSVMDCVNLHRLTGWRRMVLRFFWFTWPIKRVRLVTTISEVTRQELICLVGAPPGKVRVVHCCVSPWFTQQSTVFNASLPRVLMIGTTPNKNLERMAKALEGVPCTVDLIGLLSSAQAAVFASFGVDLRVHCNVSNAEIVEAYRRCDLLLFASTYEGFGMPIVEAQAVGRPVVTSNCSAMPEVAGDGACFVDPFDSVAIRVGVNRVIVDANYRAEIVQRGFANARRFSAEKIAREYAAIYREIAQANGVSR